MASPNEAPVETIIDAGRLIGQDVQGTHGYGGLRSLLAGYATQAASELSKRHTKLTPPDFLFTLYSPGRYAPLSTIHFREQRNTTAQPHGGNLSTILIKPGEPHPANKTLLSITSPEELEPEEETFLRGMAQPLMPTLASSFAEYQRACMDKLLTVGNREGLAAHLSQYTFGARPQPRTVLVADAEDLKFVNANWSHAVGDLYLQTIANGAKLLLRKQGTYADDFIARLGGDELLILSSMGTEEAAKFAARWGRIVNRWYLAGTRSDMPDFEHGSISVAYAPIVSSVEDAIHKAEQLAMAEKARKKTNKLTLSTRYPQFDPRST